MSESSFADDGDVLADEAVDAGSVPDSVRTGDPAVDAVLDELGDLDGVPVDEHVAVFERAHEQLRRALDAAPDTDPDTDA